MAKVALVVGGAGAIGSAVCRTLEKAGFSVAVADIELESAKKVARAFKVDATEETSVASLFKEVETAMGPVVALISVAGGTLHTRDYRPTVDETTLADWQFTEALNARGTFLVIREYIRRRKAVPVTDGRIVTFSSLAAQSPGSPAGVAYAAAKAAVIGLTRYVALEVASLGITANAIAPGAVDTGAFWTTVSEAQGKTAVANTPMRRMGTPEDIASAVAFLVSPAAGFITGCTLDVNGGRLMR
jgi:3-oxoacyl-[acyl-carrier protein] reductase